MNVLIEQCEAATGPDRKLDVAIAKALGLKHGPDSGWVGNDTGDYWTVDESAAYYTRSYDAAMSLVPEGRSVILQTAIDRRDEYEMEIEGPWASAALSYEGSVRWFKDEAIARTPQLAICAAVFRAAEE